MRHKVGRTGFTLIELMVVVIIIAALAGMVLPRVLPRTDEAKKGIAKADIQGIITALKFFRLHNDRYPTTEEGLAALISAPPSAKNWQGPYLDKRSKPVDPWKREYQYRYPSTHGAVDFDVWSMGLDEQAADDDVTNWED